MKLWFLVIAVWSTFFGFSQETKKIANAFYQYKNAVTTQQGTASFNMVNQNTIKFYNQVWSACKVADSATVSNYPFEEKLWILTTRHLIPKTKVPQLNPQKLFEYLVQKNWIHKENITNLQLGEINVDGNFAIAQMQIDGEDIPYFFQFEKENGYWKVNLIAMLEAAGRNVEAMIATGKLSENKFIIESIEKISGKKTNKAIWLPYKS